MKKKFTERLIDAIASCDDRITNEIGTLCRWEGRNGYVPNGLYYRMQARIKTLESVRYNEDDLRGLSIAEKDFVRDNSYRCYVDSRGIRYYMFIAKNLTTGKKQIYGYSKKQLIFPNGNDVWKHRYNYACWLVLRPNDYRPFSTAFYEVRGWQSLSPIAI